MDENLRNSHDSEWNFLKQIYRQHDGKNIFPFQLKFDPYFVQISSCVYDIEKKTYTSHGIS